MSARPALGPTAGPEPRPGRRLAVLPALGGPGRVDPARPHPLLVVVTVVTTAVVICYSLFTAIPSTTITLPAEQRSRQVLVEIFPQGWGFFTKSPRDEEIVPVRIDGASSVSLSAGPASRASNVMGFDRVSRAQGVEIAVLAAGLTDAEWVSCRGATGRVCGSGPVGRVVVNPTPSPTLCGRVTLVRAAPVPWAWRAQVDPSQAPARAATLMVSCRGA